MSTRPLRHLVVELSTLLAADPPEDEILRGASGLLAALIARDDWLPEAFARPDPTRYRQYLLHCDSAERFSVASFVWAPGQETPIHNHTVWGVVGVLRGGEMTQTYDGLGGTLTPRGSPRFLAPGAIELLSPRDGDIHRVWNASPDRASISIHLYGGNIGAIRRSSFAEDGTVTSFVSGYANAELPNIWSEPRTAG